MEDGSAGAGGEGSTSGGRFPILQANRDPESNWEVDVAKSLEEYLLKICSGEISGEDFNFAEGTAVWMVAVFLAAKVWAFFYGWRSVPGFV